MLKVISFVTHTEYKSPLGTFKMLLVQEDFVVAVLKNYTV